MWNLIVQALKEALKEKVTEMTKEEVKEWLDKLGVKVEEVTDELIAKVRPRRLCSMLRRAGRLDSSGDRSASLPGFSARGCTASSSEDRCNEL